jgi:hypothetical protein
MCRRVFFIWSFNLRLIYPVVKRSRRGTCLLCRLEENASHIFLNGQETQRWREEILGKKWLDMTEAVAFKKLVRCPQTRELRQLGIFLYKFGCKWEHHTKQSGQEEVVL